MPITIFSEPSLGVIQYLRIISLAGDDAAKVGLTTALLSEDEGVAMADDLDRLLSSLIVPLDNGCDGYPPRLVQKWQWEREAKRFNETWSYLGSINGNLRSCLNDPFTDEEVEIPQNFFAARAVISGHHGANTLSYMDRRTIRAKMIFYMNSMGREAAQIHPELAAASQTWIQRVQEEQKSSKPHDERLGECMDAMAAAFPRAGLESVISMLSKVRDGHDVLAALESTEWDGANFLELFQSIVDAAPCASRADASMDDAAAMNDRPISVTGSN